MFLAMLLMLSSILSAGCSEVQRAERILPAGQVMPPSYRFCSEDGRSEPSHRQIVLHGWPIQESHDITLEGRRGGGIQFGVQRSARAGVRPIRRAIQLFLRPSAGHSDTRMLRKCRRPRSEEFRGARCPLRVFELANRKRTQPYKSTIRPNALHRTISPPS